MNNKQTRINNSHEIFVFDLHGVIFSLNLPDMIRAFFRSSYKKRLLATFLYPRIFYHLLRIWYKGGVVEHYIEDLPTRYSFLEPCIYDIITILNEQRPIQDTIAFLYELKARGYTILMFTNNGECSIQLLQKKYPAIFSLFDGIQCAQKNTYKSKPHVDAFNHFFKRFNCRPEQTILIDDSVHNIVTAQSLGMRGIHFKKKNSLISLLIQKIS